MKHLPNVPLRPVVKPNVLPPEVHVAAPHFELRLQAYGEVRPEQHKQAEQYRPGVELPTNARVSLLGLKGDHGDPTSREKRGGKVAVAVSADHRPAVLGDKSWGYASPVDSAEEDQEARRVLA